LGSTAHGIGASTLERLRYDEFGNLLGGLSFGVQL
jgi:hypothetical protein